MGQSLDHALPLANALASRELLLHAPTYNHPVFLSRRKSFMAYPGHLWSGGLSYAEREAEIRRVYS